MIAWLGGSPPYRHPFVFTPNMQIGLQPNLSANQSTHQPTVTMHSCLSVYMYVWWSVHPSDHHPGLGSQMNERMSAHMPTSLLVGCIHGCLLTFMYECMPECMYSCLSVRLRTMQACPPTRLGCCLPALRPECVYYCPSVCRTACLVDWVVSDCSDCLHTCMSDGMPVCTAGGMQSRRYVSLTACITLRCAALPVCRLGCMTCCQTVSLPVCVSVGVCVCVCRSANRSACMQRRETDCPENLSVCRHTGFPAG